MGTKNKLTNSNSKNENSHNLLILMSLQTCMIFFGLCNTKGESLNVKKFLATGAVKLSQIIFFKNVCFFMVEISRTEVIRFWNNMSASTF